MDVSIGSATRDYLDDRELIQRSGLFDENYYSLQCQLSSADFAPLDHFLEFGWKKGLNPGPFFDTKYYLSQFPELLQQKICPLIDYLRGWRKLLRNPNALFDTKFYLEQLRPGAIGGENPLLHYIKTDEKLISPHPLFDPDFYLSINEDVRNSSYRPWCHYWLWGRFEGRTPNALFCPQYYANQLASAEQSNFVSAIDHYIGQGWHCDFWTSESFDPKTYRQLYPQVTDKCKTPLEHFFLECRKFGTTVSDGLRAVFADSSKNTDARGLGGELGAKSQRMWTTMTYRKLAKQLAESGKEVMLFLGHEGSRTGAPLILLSLIKHFVQSNYACVLLLREGGPLVSDYAEYAEVLILHESPQKWQVERLIDSLSELIETGRLKGAIVNTAVNAGLYNCVKSRGIHTITLVHEFLEGFDLESLAQVYRDSDQIVFPSAVVKDNANEIMPLGDLVTHVMPQGLLRSDFGRIDREQARQDIREALGLSADSFIVLGCGTLSLRKGFDFFVACAERVLRAYDAERPIHFVWLGAESYKPYSLHYFSLWDMRQCKLEKNLHIVSNRADNEQWFVGADVFYLSSRQDPFPCVVHESMASATPVIAFENSGGVAEMLCEGGGFLFQYADIESVARCILNLAENENERQACGLAGRAAVGRYDFNEYSCKIEGLFPARTKDSAESLLERL